MLKVLARAPIAMAAKRRRLADLVALGSITDSALATMLEEFARRPVDGTASRRDVSRAAYLEYQDDIGCTVALLLEGRGKGGGRGGGAVVLKPLAVLAVRVKLLFYGEIVVSQDNLALQLPRAPQHCFMIFRTIIILSALTLSFLTSLGLEFVTCVCSAVERAVCRVCACG